MSDDRTFLLTFHSLRWIDPLRRASRTIDDTFARRWIELVSSWYQALEGAELPDAVVWSPLCGSQRARTLAFGVASFGLLKAKAPVDFSQVLSTHGTRLLSIAKERPGVHSADLLVTLLILALTCNDADLVDEVTMLARRRFSETFDSCGVANAGSCWEQERALESWKALTNHFEAEGISFSQERQVLERGTDLFVHLTTPLGSLLPIGQMRALRKKPESSEYQYVSSNGQYGSPPAETMFVANNGFIIGRSGWGETERDYNEETFYSLHFGVNRKPRGHEDSMSLTYVAGGIAWLIDPEISAADDAALRKRDYHSTVVVANLALRSSTVASLLWSRREAALDDHHVGDNSYRPAHMRRRVLYSRRGEYLTVLDTLRSADPHNASQRWMIAPNVNIELQGNRAHLTHGTSYAVMEWPFGEVSGLDIEPIRGSDGVVVAQAISAHFSGIKSRIVTIISKALSFDRFRVERQIVRGQDLAFKVDTGQFAEQIVITDEGSMAASVQDPAGDVIRRLHVRLTLGSSSDGDDALRRVQARSFLTETKRRVWAASGSKEARTRSIEGLLHFARDNGIDGLRDYGIGAALIDLAARDLRHLISSEPLVTQQNRVPIISWPGSQLHHDFYDVPISSYTQVPDCLRDLPPRSMHTVDYGQLVLPAYLELAEGETVGVMFHGATDRIKNTVPRFERIRSMRSLTHGPSMFFSDPGMDMDMGMILAWYAGHESLNLHAEIAKFVQHFAASHSKKNIVLIGNSGGAFTALQVSSYIEGSTAIAFNPQIQIDRYSPRMAEAAHSNNFGVLSVRDDKKLASRMDLIKRFEEVDFDRRVYLIQNTGDSHHFEEHFKPFAEAFNGSANPRKLKTFTPYLGPGHRVPVPQEYLRLVREGIEWSLQRPARIV